MADDRTIVVVGGGQAGGRAAEAACAAGWSGRVLVLAGEPRRPYERPPLSKAVLTGKAGLEVTDLDLGEAAERVEVRTGVRVTGIDRTARTLTTAHGETIGYDGLVLATGSRPRTLSLPGADLPGIQTFRDADDALALRESVVAGERIVVIGGGYIGMEIAASARACECPVTVLEAAPTVMARQVVRGVGDWFVELHRRHGADVVLGAKVAGFEGEQRVTGVRLDDGTVYPADRVVVGVGIAPNVELADAAGLTVDDGIVVDEHAMTEDPAIAAAGDCTSHPNPLLGRRIRLESWQNAEYQGRAAGATLAGELTRHAQLPWFWSDQHGVNLQMVGLPEHWDREIWRGTPDDGPCIVFLMQDGYVVGAQAIDNGKDIAVARRMIERDAKPDPDALADPAASLKKVLKAAS
ncbi:3-phenylpropionate/trans-cinnamate dioxygenase ferredoxin reductase subunit [Limimonas halophila]|uniref:3-phenylpropionate/trans-cinnamate dioxygenase ferredoxin reductase subunit n=1 Tax=Limimonas halophila TaxID=1082479 RepID=A0A1G7MFH1_9PROT|nr:FAD-dependent oxidoreductase [Limimonas halophila]SDF60477.1 3-phenylpropionate/trans-cinnamate dioxygenase ferredoxin reductase subunit [Limimonas halophila]